jgi:Ca2+-binding RTX toxin-like protein
VSADVNFFPWALNAAFTSSEPCTTGTTVTSTASDQVLCAPSGSTNAFLANGGTGNVLLIGNAGNDQLVGTATAGSKTWIIGGTRGANAINGKGGTGFIQKRGDHRDTVVNASHYTIAAR